MNNQCNPQRAWMILQLGDQRQHPLYRQCLCQRLSESMGGVHHINWCRLQGLLPLSCVAQSTACPVDSTLKGPRENALTWRQSFNDSSLESIGATGVDAVHPPPSDDFERGKRTSCHHAGSLSASCTESTTTSGKRPPRAPEVADPAL